MGLLMFIVGFLMGGGIVYTYYDAYTKEYEKRIEEGVSEVVGEVKEFLNDLLVRDEERKDNEKD